MFYRKSVFWPKVLQSANSNIFAMEAFYLVGKCCVLRPYSQLTAGQNLNVLRAISDFWGVIGPLVVSARNLGAFELSFTVIRGIVLDLCIAVLMMNSDTV